MTHSDTSEGVPSKLNMLKLLSQQQVTPQILLCLCLMNELCTNVILQPVHKLSHHTS